jgi:hypothetical protein
MGKNKNKRLGWKVAHSACSEPEKVAEAIVKAYIEKNFLDMLHTADQYGIEYERKDSLKIVNALKSADVLLVWHEEEKAVETSI